MVTTIIISIILLCIDQISKLLVVNLLTKTDSITIIKNFFYLTYINNDGAAFSILVGKRIFLILIAVSVIVMLIRYIKKNNIQNKLELVSISLIIGGSLGNLMDRVIRGYVIDFLDFKIFNYNFPIFNLADTFIVIGVFLLLLKEIRKEKHMGFNYQKELIKWNQWKKQEEELLKALNVDDNIIKQLYDYDWEMFKTERRIRGRQDTTINTVLNNIPYYDKKEINTIDDLLSEIENEALFNYLSTIDKETLTIILLKIFGYSTHEISEILSLSHSSIYKKIHRLRKKLKKF